MHLGRLLDDKAPNYLKQGLGWSYHAPCAGHDGIQVALGVTFRPGHDYLFPYYRDLTTCLAAGLSAEEILLNGMSKRDDVASGGRHMSNHFAKPEIHVQNVSSCVSNHAQHAAGLGRALRTYGSDAIVFCSVGESSTSEGYFYEAVNGASREKLSVVFVVQDNGYGIAVPKSDQTANPFASDNFSGFLNVKIVHCDGRDLFDSLRAMREAVAFAKSGAGCALVHAECVRIHSHSNSDRHELYRSPEELAAAKAQDPLARLRRVLVEGGAFSEEEIAAIEDANRKTYEESADRARRAPDPDPASIFEHVVPEPWVPEGDGLATTPLTPETVDGKPTTEMSLIQALNGTLKEMFRENPDTYLWGQDVAYKEKGGIFNVTKGMQQEFGPKRVFNGPLAEDFILGTADGFSRLDDKIRVVVEGAEFADYFWPAAEQMVEMSHEFWRTNGKFVPNVTVRIASGGYIGGGLYHSQNIEGWLATLPGIRIVVPAFADDAAGLLRTSMRSRGITLYLEPKFLYNSAQAKARVPSEFAVPFGVARRRREGQRSHDRRVRHARALRAGGGRDAREGRKERRGARPALARAARLRRHRRLGEEDVPRPRRPRGQGARRLRRRARRAHRVRALRVLSTPRSTASARPSRPSASTASSSGRSSRTPRRSSRRRRRRSPTEGGPRCSSPTSRAAGAPRKGNGRLPP